MNGGGIGGITGKGGSNVSSGSGPRSKTSGKLCSTSSGGAEAVVFVRRGRTAAGKSAGIGTLRTVAATRTTPRAELRAALALLPEQHVRRGAGEQEQARDEREHREHERTRLTGDGGDGGVHAVAGVAAAVTQGVVVEIGRAEQREQAEGEEDAADAEGPQAARVGVHEQARAERGEHERRERHGAAGDQLEAAAQRPAEAATAGTGPYDERREGGQRAQGETGEIAVLVRREERLARPRAACRGSPLAGRARTAGGRSPRRRGLAAGCHRGRLRRERGESCARSAKRTRRGVKHGGREPGGAVKHSGRQGEPGGPGE